MGRKLIITEKAPKAIGAYNQAVASNGFVFTAGQIPIDPATGKVVEGNFKLRVDQVLKNIKAILDASGSSLDHCVKLTVFLTDLGKFQELNEVFNEWFDEVDPPARSAVQVSALPAGVDVEIECVAEVL